MLNRFYLFYSSFFSSFFYIYGYPSRHPSGQIDVPVLIA